MITSKLNLDKQHLSTLEDLCIKYANININETCPVCICHEPELEDTVQSLDCHHECGDAFEGNAIKGELLSTKGGIPSLGFDMMDGQASLNQNESMRSQKEKNKKKFSIVNDVNEDDILSIMDDELPYKENTKFTCENLEAKIGKLEVEKEDLFFEKKISEEEYKTSGFKTF